MFVLGILIWLIIAVVVIIAYWRIFERAGKPGWYALVWPIGSFILGLIGWKSDSILFVILSLAFMSFNMFILARIANKIRNFWYFSWWLLLAMILLSFGKLILLCIILYIFAFVQLFIISYWLAQSFWRRKSASVLFALTPWINYLVLWFSNDLYVWNTGVAHSSNDWINNNISPDINIIMQDEPEQIVQPVNPVVNSMNGTGVNLDNINWNDIDTNGAWVNLSDVNIDEMTPIGAIERPKHDNNSGNL